MYPIRRRMLPALIGSLCALALFDVLSGWSVFTMPAVVVCLAASVFGLVLGARRLPLVIVLLAGASFAIHLVCVLGVGYEMDHWDRLREGEARRILAKTQGFVENRISETSDVAARASGRSGLVESMRGVNRDQAFAALEEIGSATGWAERDYGLAVTDVSENVFAWKGTIPDYVGDVMAPAAAGAAQIRRSTAHHWIQAHSPIGVGGDRLGGLYVFRRLDAVYPGVLPEAPAITLSRELTAAMGNEVEIQLGAGGAPHGGGPDEGVTGEIHLPSGTVVGTATVRARTPDDMKDSLLGQGLFVASLVVLGIVSLGLMELGKHLLGFRFKRASNINMAIFLCALGGARLVLSLVRDFLGLDAFRPFTSYDYATQFPLAVARSPADLAITSLFAGVGVILLMLARAYRQRSKGRAEGGYEMVPLAVLGFVVGIVAAGALVSAGEVLRRVFADSAVDLFFISPFDFIPSHIIMRVGFFGLTVTMILFGAALIGWQISLLRRVRLSKWFIGRPFFLAALIVCAAGTVLVVAGASPLFFLIAALCLAWAYVLDRLLWRRMTIGLVGLSVGLAVTGSVLEYPYALDEHITKQRDSIEAVSSEIMARTDAWKISVLEEAISQVAEVGEIKDVLSEARAGRDAFALSLWANSILSRAHVTSGIHILDRSHSVIGRFSIDDISDLAEIEGILRSVRFSTQPMRTVTRGTFNGKDAELYLGVVPFFRGVEYLGSVLISIPFAYGDLEIMAGLKPTFFETIGGGSRPHDDKDYAASLVASGRVLSTTAKDFEVGKLIPEIEGVPAGATGWIAHKVAGNHYASYVSPPGDGDEALLLSLRLPSASDNLIHFMGMTVGNLMIAFLIIAAGAAVTGLRYLCKRTRGMARAAFRWSFASKLALAFVLIAIVPTLILGAASRRFLRSRLEEIMESKAGESLNLSKLALERLVLGETTRLARNPILIDELTAEPSIISILISHDVASAVIDSAGNTLASFGDPGIPPEVLESVLSEGRTYNFFSLDEGLHAKSAVPVRDIIFPDRIRGCAFVSRRIDDGLADRLSLDIDRDVNFFGGSLVAASSKREIFVSELMPRKISADAYLECFEHGRELHFTWERIAKTDVVVGYSPLRGFDGKAVGAISIPVLFKKDDVTRRMEWTSAAISYLLVLVIGSIFILGLVLARRISRPIRELIEGTLRIGSGDLAFTIPKSGDDEIGDLVTSFNKMTVALARSRKTLSERKRYIETILANVGAGIVSTDWRGRIDTFNSAAERILGVRGRNARGRDAKNLLGKIGASSLAAALSEVGRGEGMVRKEVVLARQNGNAVTLRAVATAVMGPRGRQMGKVIVFEDVTELIRSKKLIAWSEMARQVAHEIKNPLTPMKLSAQQLLQSRRDGAGNFDQVLEEGIATIIEQIESLRRIAVEFSQFSRMPERKLEMLGINEIIDESLAQYERTVAPSIQIVKQLGTALPRVRVDRDEMKRVFLNLVENAVQAMPRGGRLTVRSRKHSDRDRGSSYAITVSSRSEHENRARAFVEIAFTDTGVGISPDNAERLFEPNFSTKTQGTGLGLAISKGIVDAYAGEILIESTHGAGTSVKVRIPVADKPILRRRPRRRGSSRQRRSERG
jgi:PAS domain S-box-containing protein